MAAALPLLASGIGAGATAPALATPAAPVVGAAPAMTAGAPGGTGPIELRPLSTSADLRIVDDLGRDVLLRGANLNSLGEYWQGDPATAPTIPVTDADWAAMSARGLSVVRLIITWSKVEPQPGVIDHAYLDAVDAQVQKAASYGIYSVIDMHQDAWGPGVATTDPASCPSGLVPGKGWDGAPVWATLLDGATTCTPGDRYASPAVLAAFTNFYNNTNGIRDHFVSTWGAVAARFAGRPEVAGYDVLNEPAVPAPAAQIEPLYDALLHDAVTAIRAAEAAAPFPHLIFVEPALPAGDIANGLVIPDPVRSGVSPTGIVGAPHNYAESIGIPGLSVTIEQMSDLYLQITRQKGVPLWIGEYGFWDTSPATLDKVRRTALDEDAKRIGGAWWQWRQSCGDPHAVYWDNGTVVVPGGTSVQLNLLTCPANTDAGPNEAFLHVLGRGYPRAAPGRLTSLVSDPTTGQLDAAATVSTAGGTLLVWTPTPADAAHAVRGENLTSITETAVPGGRLVTATVTAPGCYALHVGTTTVSCPAPPVSATPAFTG